MQTFQEKKRFIAPQMSISSQRPQSKNQCLFQRLLTQTVQLYKTSRKQWSKLNALTVVDALAFLAATNRKEAFCRTY